MLFIKIKTTTQKARKKEHRLRRNTKTPRCLEEKKKQGGTILEKF